MPVPVLALALALVLDMDLEHPARLARVMAVHTLSCECATKQHWSNKLATAKR